LRLPSCSRRARLVCIATRRVIIILTVSRCCSFCRRFLTTRPLHSSSDGTTLAACASAHHIQTIHSDALSRVSKRATVLDGHGSVCAMTYRQVSSTFSSKEGFRYTVHSNYIRIEILLLQLQLHRRGITAWTADIQRLSAVSSFKTHLKTYLFMTAYSC